MTPRAPARKGSFCPSLWAGPAGAAAPRARQRPGGPRPLRAGRGVVSRRIMGGTAAAAITWLPQTEGSWGMGTRCPAPPSSCDKCALCQATLQRLAPSCMDLARSERRGCCGAGLLRTPRPRAGVWIAPAGVSPTPHRRATAHAPRRGPYRIRALPPCRPNRATLVGTPYPPAPYATSMARWPGIPYRCGPPVVYGPPPAATPPCVPHAEEAHTGRGSLANAPSTWRRAPADTGFPRV